MPSFENPAAFTDDVEKDRAEAERRAEVERDEMLDFLGEYDPEGYSDDEKRKFSELLRLAPEEQKAPPRELMLVGWAEGKRFADYKFGLMQKIDEAQKRKEKGS